MLLAVARFSGRPGIVFQSQGDRADCTSQEQPYEKPISTNHTSLLACFVVRSTALAVESPPDDGYANGNTPKGENALFSLTIGANNTAIGFNALFSNTTGGANTATGGAALYFNTTGNNNTATGSAALYYNTTGSKNTANGKDALSQNITGIDNTAIGFVASGKTTGSNMDFTTPTWIVGGPFD